MREKVDAAVGLLLFRCAEIPGNGRNAECGAGQEAEGNRRNHEVVEEIAALLGFVDESCNDRNWPAVDHHRHIGFGEMCRLIVGGAGFDIDLGRPRSPAAGGIGVEL